MSVGRNPLILRGQEMEEGGHSLRKGEELGSRHSQGMRAQSRSVASAHQNLQLAFKDPELSELPDLGTLLQLAEHRKVEGVPRERRAEGK